MEIYLVVNLPECQNVEKLKKYFNTEIPHEIFHFLRKLWITVGTARSFLFLAVIILY
jgi:hypothetical protein